MFDELLARDRTRADRLMRSLFVGRPRFFKAFFGIGDRIATTFEGNTTAVDPGPNDNRLLNAAIVRLLAVSEDCPS